MSYQDDRGRIQPQQGKNGGAYVIVVDESGTPVAAGSTDLSPLVTRYGDVSTNPAANTVLGRLKDITQAIYAPKYTTVTITNLTTDAVGINWTAFGSLACEILEVVNDTGTDLEYRRGGAGLTMIIPAGQTRQIRGITNANTISFKRKDSSNTQVTVRAEALKI
jgi:hypothetical protein